MDIRGKKAIVTGGVRGIGRKVVDRLMAEGATVGVFDIDSQGLASLKNFLPALCCMECDVTRCDQVAASVDAFYGTFQAVDILVNNAGFIYNSPLVGLTSGGIRKHDLDMWRKVLDANLSSVFYMAVHVAEKMIANRTKGVIVNVSSVCAAGNPGQCAYSAAKAGVNALTATWAKELGALGIRVAGIAPGYTKTESTLQAVNADTLKAVIGKVPLRRLGEVDEIAEGIMAIIKNDFFNGKILELDGGLIV